jgi:hypothetical protein
VLVACVVWVVWPGEREPSYQGKKLSQSLLVYYRSIMPSVKPDAEELRNAWQTVWQIGTNALPCLLKWTKQDDEPWETALRAIERLPRPLRQLALSGPAGVYFARKNGQPRHRDLAWFGFLALRWKANPAVPELVRLLNDSKSTPLQRAGAMRALSCIGEAGLGPLLAAVRDPEIRRTSLRFGSGDLNLAMPPEYFICSMLNLGTNAIPAVPVVITWVTNTDISLAHRAARILGWWGVESELVVPALESSVRATNYVLRQEAVIALGKFGERAKMAVPALLEALGDEDPLVRTESTNALRKIAPEVLTNGVVK